MKLYNTLTKQLDTVAPADSQTVRLYSCGPTVYDHAHIGNLSAYIFADTLRRTIGLNYPVKHVMNYTDVDDKTIRRSQAEYDDSDARQRLQLLTDKYIALFNDDMARIGNDIESLTFVRATDERTIEGMQELIRDLHQAGIAYVADDGVYFSIEAYRRAGKTYGQLLEITAQNTSDARIQNDEYDKESVHDFALWKKQKAGEPAWQFELDGQDLQGRPGWHIECSVMSQQNLGQPFDIHTGGIDLIFPHHENEIAQSTALTDNPVMATIFAHNDHILVDGKKMSKSAQNFYTLQDIIDKGFDPLAFRILVLQAHYRSQVNFTWESLEAAQNRLQELRAWADLRWQAKADTMPDELDELFRDTRSGIQAAMENDLSTPAALAVFGKLVNYMMNIAIPGVEGSYTDGTLAFLDQVFGLQLSQRHDISHEQKQLIAEREAARESKDWSKSDQLRDKLKEQGLGLRDTPYGAYWYRL
jgi:cysteinyl-tRNA synthetase